MGFSVSEQVNIAQRGRTTLKRQLSEGVAQDKKDAPCTAIRGQYLVVYIVNNALPAEFGISQLKCMSAFKLCLSDIAHS